MNDPYTVPAQASFADKLSRLNELSSGEFDAFLYDCDGTLADSMPGHKKAYAQVAAHSGLQLDVAMIDELAGLPVEKVVEEINRRYGSRLDPAVFAREKEQLFFDAYIDSVAPIDFVVAHMKMYQGRKKIAVVSGGGRPSVEKTLQVLGIGHIPDTLVCAGETERGKPDPAPFLEAARKLGVAPERCFVFEDADAGIRAATAAGMGSVRIDRL